MQAVILIGLPGAGKTTFYRQQFFERHVRISLDMLRMRNRERDSPGGLPDYAATVRDRRCQCAALGRGNAGFWSPRP
jgi:hypothetical protein